MIGKRRVRTRSKLLAVFLSAVMLVSLIPIGTVIFQKAGAIGPNTVYDYSVVHDDEDGHKPTRLEPGEVWTDKRVEKDPNIAENGRFNITLSAIAGDNPTVPKTQYDIVFLLDVSQSMTSSDLTTLRNAANTAINAALSNKTDEAFNRVAVITFGRGATRLKFPIDGKNETWLTSQKSNGHISSLSRDGYGTNMQAALYEAYKLLRDEGRVDAIPAIILMSDGAPNCYARLKKINLFAQQRAICPLTTTLAMTTSGIAEDQKDTLLPRHTLYFT